MADPAVVAGLLLDRCEQLKTQGPSLPVAMPDVSFSPPADGKYLRVDLFSNAPFWEGLSGGVVDQGLIQITVVWPKGKGIIQPRQKAALVIAHFPKGLRLFGPSTRVSINREPWAASPIPEATQTLTPITISWTAA